MLLRLRSPIFDHGTVGVPVRKQPTRRNGVKEDQELAEFREMGIALMETANPFDKDSWRAAVKTHLDWKPVEADLHLDLFETMWKVETVQRIPDIVENADMAKRLRFALFVVIQLYELHRPRRTSSMDLFNIHSVPDTKKEATEELQEDFDPRHLILESRRKEWSNRLMFVKRRIGDIVTLLTQLSNGTEDTNEDTPVPKRALDALGFLIAGSDESGERASRLSDAFFELSSPTISSVTNFLLERLVADETRNPQWSSFDLNKQWTSASSLSPPEKGSPTMIRGTSPHELVVVPPPSNSSFSLADFSSAIIVAASHGAHIICLTPATYAHVIGCSDCVIFLGPVVGVCTVEHCERVRIVGACGRIKLVNCVDVKMNIWTGTRPILLGDCRGILAGPLSARYPNVARHACAVCDPSLVISNGFQAWRHPIITDLGGVDEEDFEPSVFAVQNPDDLMMEHLTPAFPAEFDLASFSQEDLRPVPLPAEYASRLAERKQTVQSNLNLVKETILAVKQTKGAAAAMSIKNDMHNATQSAFRDWLVSSGNMDYLLSRFATSFSNQNNNGSTAGSNSNSTPTTMGD